MAKTVSEPFRLEALDAGGQNTNARVFRNLPVPALVEKIVERKEGLLSHVGSAVFDTGQYTGRSPKDKFVVNEPSTGMQIWWGPVNRPFDREKFEDIFQRILAYLGDREVFVQDCYACADPHYRFPVRVISERAWNSLFARHLFLRDERAAQTGDARRLTVISVPGFQAKPALDGTNSEAFILLSLERRLVLIGGTSYAGEIKKSVFTALNYFLPTQGILSMHCSANVGAAGDAALFFGLSGTGKTSLSTDPERRLIGDDEHGWSDNGIFNLEGGCYAKVIRLSPKAEPQIYAAANRFGAVLENVKIDPITRELDLSDDSRTENTRAAYPIDFIPGAMPSGMAGHPQNIFLLSADAFGVLPPVARLTIEQAMYYYISGYTAKVAGTERGIKDPVATFSACFGDPFLPLHPSVYARLLGDRIRNHQVNCWLINTGWLGGRSGPDDRIPIKVTRAIIHAALNGQLNDVEYDTDPIFGLQIPRNCEGVSDEMLQPRTAWSDVAAYEAQACRLLALFEENYKKWRTD